MVKQSSITDSLLFKINDELNMKTRLKSGSVTSICKTSTKMSSTLHATVLYCFISEYVSFEWQWVISSFLNYNIYLNFSIGLQICNSNPIIHCTKWVFSSISGAKKAKLSMIEHFFAREDLSWIDSLFVGMISLRQVQLVVVVHLEWLDDWTFPFFPY